jgi:iron-sulfur cluster repair protein YtfE (RIC family)
MSPFVHVTANCTVNDVLGRYPATAPVIRQLGLDTCCDADRTLREAATQARTDLGVVLSMLEASASASFGAVPFQVRSAPRGTVPSAPA